MNKLLLINRTESVIDQKKPCEVEARQGLFFESTSTQELRWWTK